MTETPKTGDRYRHLKRGSEYTIIGSASLQIATDTVVDGSDVVLYQSSEYPQVWAREVGEFMDGRFERMTSPKTVTPDQPQAVPDAEPAHIDILRGEIGAALGFGEEPVTSEQERNVEAVLCVVQSHYRALAARPVLPVETPAEGVQPTMWWSPDHSQGPKITRYKSVAEIWARQGLTVQPFFSGRIIAHVDCASASTETPAEGLRKTSAVPDDLEKQARGHIRYLRSEQEKGTDRIAQCIEDLLRYAEEWKGAAKLGAAQTFRLVSEKTAGVETPAEGLRQAGWRDISTAPTDGTHALFFWSHIPESARKMGSSPLWHHGISIGWFEVDEDWDDRPKGWVSPQSGFRMEGDQCLAVNQADCRYWMPLPSTAPAPLSGRDATVDCQTCQGNGEIVTDWSRYLKAEPGDSGDEGTADCPDCYGSGRVPLSGMDGSLREALEEKLGEMQALYRAEHDKLGQALLDKSVDGRIASNWQGGRVNGIHEGIAALRAALAAVPPETAEMENDAVRNAYLEGHGDGLLTSMAAVDAWEVSTARADRLAARASSSGEAGDE